MMQISKKTLDFIGQHKDDNVRSLALKGTKDKDIDLTFALDQIEGRQIAAHKIPTWAETNGIIYPPHLSMEQCSSEPTACYKANVIRQKLNDCQDAKMADLTGGFGIDCSFIGRHFDKVTYVERQPNLCDVARHNFEVLNLKQFEVVNADGCEYLEKMEPVNCLFLDPARRSASGRKTVLIEECEPNIIAMESAIIAKSDFAMIKLSPMLDLFQAMQKLKSICEVHVVAAQNECKELLLVLSREELKPENVPIKTYNIASDKTEQRYCSSLSAEASAECKMADFIGSFLYEPNAAILKAGLNRSLCSTFGVEKLHANSQLYTSNTLVPDFPGRIFSVEASSTFGKKELKELMAGITQANITVRNFPGTAEELKKRLRLKDGGTDYLFATTLNNNKKTIIRCKKL